MKMSKPQFSKKRKGKSVPTYPLGAEREVSSSKRTRKTKRGRPRKGKVGPGILFWRDAIEKKYLLHIVDEDTWNSLRQEELTDIALERLEPLQYKDHSGNKSRLIVEKDRLTLVGEGPAREMRVPAAETMGDIELEKVLVYPLVGSGVEVEYRWETYWKV